MAIVSNMTMPSVDESAEGIAESTVRDYVALLKPRVMSLVVFCGAVGLWLAPASMPVALQVITLLCIALATGGSGALNMWHERNIDAKMTRTKDRPVAAGRVAPEEASAFGSVMCFFSVIVLGLATNWLAAGLLALAIGIYVGVYTVWLKPRTAQNIVIGGASGALPPVIAWAAVTGTAPLEAWALFVIIFLWTPAHFWAIALFRHDDYRNAGLPMLPITKGQAHTKIAIWYYTLAVVASSFVPFMLGTVGMVYAACAGMLGAWFVLRAAQLRSNMSEANAKRVFFVSMYFLFLLFAAMLLDQALGLGA